METPDGTPDEERIARADSEQHEQQHAERQVSPVPPQQGCDTSFVGFLVLCEQRNETEIVRNK